MSRNCFRLRSMLFIIIMFCGLVACASAVSNINGDSEYTTVFTVTATKNNAYIKLKSYKGTANITVNGNKISMGTPKRYEKDEPCHGFYSIKVSNGKTYDWAPSAKKTGFFYSGTVSVRGSETSGTLTINFPNPGTYTVSVVPYTTSEAISEYWLDDKFNYWKSNATWKLTNESGCTCSFNGKKGNSNTPNSSESEKRIIPAFVKVLCYDQSGNVLRSSSETITSSQWIKPVEIQGYHCESTEYISYNSDGTAKPSSVSFVYIKDEPKEGYISINCYDNNGNWLKSDIQTVLGSQYVYPPVIDGYTAISSAVYISYNNGNCSPTDADFYYEKNIPPQKEGYISVNCYDDNDNWLKGYELTITESQYVYPPAANGYTTISDPVYISLDSAGHCSPSYAHFYYTKIGDSRPSSGSRIIPTGWTTQFDDQANNLYKLDDDNSSTFFWWLIYKSNRTDSIPELTAYFNNATISNISMRSGRPGQHYDYARVARFRVEIHHSGTTSVTYAHFADSASDNYQTVSLGGTYYGVSQIDLYLDGGNGEGFYEGTGKGRYYIYIKDIKFGN